jgi:dihydrofolate reductase
MIIISAMGSNRVIGSGDRMPWSVPQEYRQFVRFVTGQTVIMGRRSWQIFGPDLTRSRNIVVSRSLSRLDGALVVDSIEAAVEAARGRDSRIFCAGGAQIYAQMLPLADELYLSFIKGDFGGDAFFPEFDETEWLVVKREDHPAFEFVVYRRR